MSEPSAVRAKSVDELTAEVMSLARAGKAGDKRWNTVQGELARRRVEDARDEPLPTRRSLRAEILDELAHGPGSTPTQLAAALDRSTTVVSRVLASLLEAKHVQYASSPDDGRIRHYSLIDTSASASASAVGAPTASEEDREYLGLAIAAAVRGRRRSNDLDYAADRLQRVLDRALEIGAENLALLARRELVTTLRQSDNTSEVSKHVAAFRSIAAGKTPIRTDLVAAATACLDYELGRTTDLPDNERLDHLTAAATAFQRCDGLPEAHDWAPREGWALLARADIWRRQTEFGVALSAAKRAESVFAVYGDRYGMTESTRIQGFCERLRGNFQEALDTLKTAQTLAEDDSADRSLADVLLQAGDAHRCLGEYEMAADKLNNAVDLARSLQRHRTLGFSLTALAAVRYNEGEIDEAWKLSQEAEPYLKRSPAGAPFNQRRQAVIASRLAAGGDANMAATSVDLFTHSMARYRELDSPAGIAACYVGLGATDKQASHLRNNADGLVEVARSGSGRLLLPMDPWVPKLLANWAAESGSDDVRRVAEWVDRGDSTDGGVDDMAGEPRLLSEALAA